MMAAVASYQPEFDEYIRPFERAWANGEVPSLAKAIQAIPSGMGRLLFWELATIDMEFRWRKSQQPSHGLPLRPRWQDYLTAHPCLGTLAELPPAYAAEEYRVRAVWGDAPPHDKFIAAFPNQLTQLVSLLKTIDTELRADGLMDIPRLASAEAFNFKLTQDDLLPFSDFVLHEHLGTGGFGKVYRAWRKSEARFVAIKGLLKKHQRNPVVVQQFIQEARILARLNHPNIVQTFGLGQFPSGGYFFALELIDGVTLQQKIEQARLTFFAAIRMVIEVAAAVQYAHEQGVIHGDLKPSNVLIDGEGRPHIADFGLAALLLPGFANAEFHGGTAGYLAPEIRSNNVLSPQADVYALGALLVALLTGAPPNITCDVNRNSRKLNTHELPAALQAGLQSALAREPSQRLSSAGELAEILQGLQLQIRPEASSKKHAQRDSNPRPAD